MGTPKVRTIGVLTSGGDAPAMNAATRAVVRVGLERGLNVKGIRKGYNGLLNEDIIDLQDILQTVFHGEVQFYLPPAVMSLRHRKDRKGAQKCAGNRGSTDW